MQEHADSEEIEALNKSYDEIGGRVFWEAIVEDFADNKIKFKQYDKKKEEYYITMNGYKLPGVYGRYSFVSRVIFQLYDAWKNKYFEDGFAETEIDEERKALLEKAQHMQVAVPPEDFIVDQDDPYAWYYLDPALVTGDDRYKYLQWINWVVFVHNIYSDTEAFYPVRSYPDREHAKEFARMKYGNNATVKPVWEIDLNKISRIY